MNENLNLVEILKGCPRGTKLYSPIYGEVILYQITNLKCSIEILDTKGCLYRFNAEGLACIDDSNNLSKECLLFPSKDNHDWSTFKVPNKLPKTWEEFCENHPIKSDEYYITSSSYVNRAIPDERKDRDENLLPNKETAEAMLALCQLIQLRDCYNEGWQPDWLDDNTKYTISFFNENIVCNNNIIDQRVLSFKTNELRNEFKRNFKNLIETAKPLL